MLDLANNDFGNVRRGYKFIEEFGRVAHSDQVAAAVALGYRSTLCASLGDDFGLGRRDATRPPEVHISREQLEALVRAARVAGLGTIVMPRDRSSLDHCAALDVDTWKIASDDIAHVALTEAIAATQRWVIVAADRAPLDDIEALLARFQARGFTYAFKHAVSVHPDPAGGSLVPQRKPRLVIVFRPPGAAASLRPPS